MLKTEDGKMVDYAVLDDYINEHLGFRYETGANHSNDSFYHIYVEEPKLEYQKESLNEKLREFEGTGKIGFCNTAGVSACMYLLWKRGLIEEGKYVVLVNW